MAKSFGIYSQARSTLDDGDYTMDHTASVLLLERQGRLLPAPSPMARSPDTAVAKLKRLAAKG